MGREVTTVKWIRDPQKNGWIHNTTYWKKNGDGKRKKVFVLPFLLGFFRFFFACIAATRRFGAAFPLILNFTPKLFFNKQKTFSTRNNSWSRIWLLR